MNLEDFLILPELVHPSVEQVMSTARERGMTTGLVLNNVKTAGFVLSEDVQLELEGAATQVIVTSYQGIFTVRHVSCIQYMKVRSELLASPTFTCISPRPQQTTPAVFSR